MIWWYIFSTWGILWLWLFSKSCIWHPSPGSDGCITWLRCPTWPHYPTPDLHESSHPNSQDSVLIMLTPNNAYRVFLCAVSGVGLQLAELDGPYREGSLLHLCIITTASEVLIRSPYTWKRGSRVGTKTSWILFRNQLWSWCQTGTSIYLLINLSVITRLIKLCPSLLGYASLF